MMPEPLTPLERQIYDYLVDYVRENSYQPSIREIGRQFAIKSTKTVSEYLQVLAEKGWIERDPARSRGVRLLGVSFGSGTVRVPRYAQLAPEGEPLAADALVDELVLDEKLVGGAGAVAVGMRGASMQDAGILDGDLLVIRPAELAELAAGDVIVGRHDDEAVVARYQADGNGMRLEPANPSFPTTLIAEPAEFLLVGRVIGVIRQLAPPIRVEAAEIMATAELAQPEEATP